MGEVAAGRAGWQAEANERGQTNTGVVRPMEDWINDQQAGWLVRRQPGR